MSTQRKTTGQKPKPEKRFGLVSFHEGEYNSSEDLATVSFKYYRTESGKPEPKKPKGK